MVSQLSSKSALRVERIQATRQLSYLGFERGDKVPLRFFYHSDDRRKDGDKGRKLDRLQWERVERFQSDGRGVYVVVNGHNGGHEDESISQCIAIFCEWDDIPIEDQVLHWETVGFLEPTFTVYSGDRSMQPYWVFDEPLTNIDQWRELQQLLIEVMNADSSNKNPSRVFRLAGGWHVKPGREPVQTQIVQDSGKKYSAEELLMKLRDIKHQQQPEQQPLNFTRYENIQVPVPESVPLEVCLSKESRSLLSSGVGEGGRNTNGAKLARDLIGTADYLTSIGQHFDGDARLLLEDYASRCNPPLPPKEAEAIWKSAQKDRPGPSCPSDFIQNNIRAWYWREYVKPTGRGYSGGMGSGNRQNFGGGSGGNGGGDGGDGGGNHLEVVSLYKRIEEVLNRQLPDPQQEDAFLSLAKAERISLSDVKGIAKELQVQTERAADLKEDSSQFKKLVNFREQQLNLNATFPTPLAKALRSKASSSRLDPIRLVQNLLPACGAVLGANVSVIVKRGVTERDHWYECAIFCTADISPPSSGKSDAQRASFEPLKEKEREELKRVAEAKKQLPQIEATWKNFTDQQKEERRGTDADPEFFKSEYIDKVRRYIWDEATIESIFKLISEQPEKAGTVWLKDELESLFKSLDQHKSGNKGNALQQIISAWSGPLWGTTDRVDKTKSYRLSGQTLNISGTVQPDVITKRLNVRDDPDGLTSRFLPAMSKLPGDFSQWSDVQVELFDCIKGLLEGLEQMQGIVEFSPSARPRWIQRWEELRRGYQHYLESNPAYAYFLGKQCSYVPRLALLLHCIEHYYQPKSNFAQIALETLERAITLSDYYCGQFRLLQAASFSQDEFPLEGLLFKVWEKVKALGKISTREVCQFARRHKWHGKKITAGVALEILTAIQTAGFGVLQGKTLYFNSPDDLPPGSGGFVDDVDQMLINDQHGQHLEVEGFKGFVDHVDQRDDQQNAAIPNGRSIAEESSLYPFVDQPDQQMGKTQDSQDLEPVDQLPTFDQHCQQVPQEAIAPTTPAEKAPQPREIETYEETPQLLQQGTVEAAPTELEEGYSVINADADEWGELVCEEQAIAPVIPLENASEPAELSTPVETPQSIAAEPTAVAVAHTTTIKESTGVTATASKAVSPTQPRQLPPVGARIEPFDGEYKGLACVVQSVTVKNNITWICAKPEGKPQKPEYCYLSGDYKILPATSASITASQNAPETAELPTVMETPQPIPAKPATEVITVVEADDEWQIGDQIVVDASDLPDGLKRFDGCSGVIQAVTVANCLVRFDKDGETMCILRRGLRRG